MSNTLVPETDPGLTTRCTDWDFNNPSRDASLLILEMIQVMRDERGMGLSANQIGVNARLFIMESEGTVRAYFNPEIVQESAETALDQEGCLSFPDLYFKVKRSTAISVRYQDISGNIVNEDLTDLKARCYAHEMDHLDGIRFTDRVSKLTVNLATKRRAKNKRNSNV